MSEDGKTAGQDYSEINMIEDLSSLLLPVQNSGTRVYGPLRRETRFLYIILRLISRYIESNAAPFISFVHQECEAIVFTEYSSSIGRITNRDNTEYSTYPNSLLLFYRTGSNVLYRVLAVSALAGYQVWFKSGVSASQRATFFAEFFRF